MIMIKVIIDIVIIIIMIIIIMIIVTTIIIDESGLKIYSDSLPFELKIPLCANHLPLRLMSVLRACRSM